jgi:hypothetical protein
MAVIEYLPVATSVDANVDPQASFAGSSYQQNGFIDGIALPNQANKIWRQTSMIAALIATWISNTLGANVVDDGNLPALGAQWVAAWDFAIPIVASGATLTQATPAAGDNSTKVATTAFVLANTQPNLGFTPVQQGGVNNDKIIIGWNPSDNRVHLTVDVSDQGGIVFEGELSSELAATNANVSVAQNTANTAIAEIAGLNFTPTATLADVTGARFLNTSYQNNTGKIICVSGAASTVGSGTGNITCAVGPGSASTIVFASEATATVTGGPVGFFFMVPAGYFYGISSTGAVNGIEHWVETAIA